MGAISHLTVIVNAVVAVTSDASGWFSGWRRADSHKPCRPVV